MFEYMISQAEFSKWEFVTLNQSVLGLRTYLILTLRDDYISPGNKITGGLAVVQEVKVALTEGGWKTSWHYRQFGDNYTDALNFFNRITEE